MSRPEIVLLGAVAGFTIFLGLPVGRLRQPAPRLRAGLNGGAVGVLIFLLWDVLSKGIEPITAALDRASHHHGSWGTFAGRGATFAIALTVGLVSLGYYERWLMARPARMDRARMDREGSPEPGFGPGAASVAELSTGPVQRLGASQRLAFFIALGIGLHNLSEGLAIGQSAASGELRLALLLIVGFGLHNATEGFGIVAPLAGDQVRPTWGFLLAMGLIGGGPTLVGTLIGQAFTDTTVFIAFLGLAAGSILYVVMELLHVGRKIGQPDVARWAILAGLLAGFATDMILTVAGA
ncbi:MAG: ZIP family metal transporter [Acidimicrobiales bacterium]